MLKKAFVGGALDAYSNLQSRHPRVTMGAYLAAGFVPGLSTAMELPNIAQDIRHNRPYSAAGRAGQAALGLVPGLSTVSRMVLPTAIGMGGDLLQRRADEAAQSAAAKAASYGGRHMTRTKQALGPLLAAALPILRGVATSVGSNAIIGGATQAIRNAQGGRDLTEGMGPAVIGGGAMGGVNHGISAGADRLMGKVPAAAQAAPPPEPKQAFARRLKAAQHRLFTPSRHTRSWEKQSMYRHPLYGSHQYVSHLGLGGLMTKLALAPDDPRYNPREGDAASMATLGSGPRPDVEGQAERQGRLMMMRERGKTLGKDEDPGMFGVNNPTAQSLMGLGGSTLMGGGAGAALGGLGGAVLGDTATGAATGAGAGMGGVLGHAGGKALAALLRAKGYGGNSQLIENALGAGGAALGGLGGGGLGYAASHKKESSYHPRVLLSSLTNAVRTGGQHRSFLAGTR